MILAIDTSTDFASVALYAPGEGVLVEQSWIAGREQTTQLLPNINRMMALVGRRVQQIEGLAVATGPGSYSGVRIGISTAKSIAYALEVPIWGVPTLDALAFQQVAVTAAQVCAVLNMGRGRLAWALYRTRGTSWSRLTDYESGTAEEMADAIIGLESQMATLFCGEINKEATAVLTEKLEGNAAITPAAAGVRRAGYLAELALQRAARGDSDDPATLQAIYLQPRAQAAERV